MPLLIIVPLNVLLFSFSRMGIFLLIIVSGRADKFYARGFVGVC